MPSYPCLADFPPLSSHQMESKHTRVLPSCEALQDFDYDTQPPASRLLLACFKQTLLPSRLSVSIFCTCANSLGNSSCFACEFSWYNRARQIYVHVPVLRLLYDHVIFLHYDIYLLDMKRSVKRWHIQILKLKCMEILSTKC